MCNNISNYFEIFDDIPTYASIVFLLSQQPLGSVLDVIG